MGDLVKYSSLSVIGIILCASGIALIYVFPTILHQQISKLIVIKNGSSTYDEWKKPPMPIYMQFYMFDVQNGDEIKAGEKPTIKQRGPYTYREGRPKIDIVFNENDTVTYRSPRSFYFDRDMSVGPDTDEITVLNIPYVTIATMLQYKSSLVKGFFSTFAEAQGERLFTKKSVKDLLWGYDDTLFREIHRWLPSMNVPDKFGVFYGQNGTDDGLYTVYTGASDAKNFTLINRWNGTELLSWWTNKQCNMINGTDGTTFPPFIEKTQRLELYSTDICRSVYTIFEAEVEIQGIPAWKFAAPPALFQNVTENPENTGFCTPSGNCLDSGVLNISNCKQGAPIVMSAPHFYMGSEKYIDGVNGLNPNKAEHDIFVTLEPNTGVMLQAARRMQINIAVKPFTDILEMTKLTDIILPILYLNESVMIDENSASTLRDQVILPQKIVLACQYAGICIGTVILLSVLLVAVVRHRRKMSENYDDRPLISSVSPDM